MKFNETTKKRLSDAVHLRSESNPENVVPRNKSSTREDEIDMDRLGRKQELRRNFKTFSILGMASVTMATWMALLLTASFSLINGGLAGTIWVYLASWLFTICVVCSLAEMASMAPTSGGQYRE